MQIAMILIMSIVVFQGLNRSRPGLYCYIALWGALGFMGVPWWVGLIFSLIITFFARAASANTSPKEDSGPSPHSQNFTSERIAQQMVTRLFRGR
jgi:uncharacterized membrane protein